MSGSEGLLTSDVPALDAVIELAREPVSIPELAYGALDGGFEPTSIEATLDPESPSLVVEWADGSVLSLDKAALDRTVADLAGAQPGLQAADPSAPTPWDAQLVLKGGSGSDRFVVADRVETDSDRFAVSFVATPGSDRYQATSQLDRIDYSQFSGDSLSGLYVTDSPERLPLVSNNLPPLIAADFASDDLLVYKNYGNLRDGAAPQLDLLTDVEVVSLGPRDDVLDLNSEHPSLVVDFAGGVDQASVASMGDRPDVARYLGLESLRWTPLGMDGQSLAPEPIPFVVQEWTEDQTTIWPVDLYPPDPAAAALGPWQLSSFALPGRPAEPLPSWLELLELPATPDLVGDGRVVISHQFVGDPKDSTLLWLELSVNDRRPQGLGLVGLQIDLDWNAAALELRRDHFKLDEVFNPDHLPLFQSLGVSGSTAGRETLKGLGAAALPRAGQGLALGLSEDDGGQTLFARLGFRRDNPAEAINLRLSPTLTPAAGGVGLAADDLLILDDSSPSVWVIRATPDQQQVGSHAFTLTRGNGSDAEQLHLAVAIREVNDAPRALEVKPDDLRVSVQQDSRLIQSVSSLFSDQDDADLRYVLRDAPDWLQLDPGTGALSAQPGNAHVGEHLITVQASDGRGGTAFQTLRLSVLNVNDTPVLGPVALQFPELSQGQSFTYRIPSGVFSDPDLLVDSQEQLTYSLLPAASDQALPRWIKLDPSTGTLSGKAGPADVGNSSFIVRATDRDGLFVDQVVVLDVANVNDAPRLSSALAAFRALQTPTTSGATPPSEDNPLALFSGLKRTIDLNLWFTDPDLGLNPFEQLSLSVKLELGNGELVDLSDSSAAPNWLAWDPSSGMLTLTPSILEVGEHYLRVVATDVGKDNEGTTNQDVRKLSASALVPLLVRHRNSAPVQQITDLAQLLQGSQLEGVLSSTPQLLNGTLTGLQLELAEDAPVRIELPASLYSDIDLSIDPAERLSYSLQASQELPFSFDSKSLSITGNTSGLALDVAGGRASWTAQLIVADAAGETASFDLELVLQRTAAAPALSALLAPDVARWNEGSAVPLTDLLALSLTSRPGEVLELLLERLDSDPQPLTLLDALDQPVAPQLDGGWLLRGTAEEVIAQLAELSLVVPNDAHAIGSFALSATASTQLGSTGLRSELVTTEISFSLDPVATSPTWLQQSEEGALDPLALNTFADFLSAALVDPREQLLYAVELPEAALDLLITNCAGDPIGIREGHQVLLTPEQWAEALLRSDGADPQPVELQVRALSTEPSNGVQAASKPLTVVWTPTPRLLSDPKAVLITPDGVQRSNETTHLSLALAWPEVVRSGQLQIDLPLGSAVALEGYGALQSEVNGLQRFVFTVQADIEQPLPRELTLEVASPEMFRGPFVGSLQLLASVRNALPAGGLSAEDFAADRDSALARLLEPISFGWDVAQVAQTPEFGPDADLSFNSVTGALQIDLRRGSNSSGIRNPAEALTLSVRDIPAGYTLAEQDENGFYRAVGATDAFGTMTLFTLPAEAGASPSALGAFTRLNAHNLYLVSLDDTPPPLTGSESLSLALSARISDQPGGDSRSSAATRQLSLAPFSGGPPPRLNNQPVVDPEVVDPLILDLSGEGLALTSLEQGVTFTMLPQAPAVPTAWLSPDANTPTQRSAALLVLNDTRNDGSDGDVTISSITELLSEYFEADTRLRSYTSGSAALASLNSNADQLLDANDQAWSELLLWFDDGDAVSEAGELVAIGDVLTSIDLGSLETLSEQPTWAAGNAVLRRLSGADLDDPSASLDLYDIGLQVAPAGTAPLPLSVTGPLQLQENGDPVTLQLASDGSDQWAAGQDALTLVRLSGLPEELVPSLGVRDSRGDWLFTWADLNANGGQLEILTSPDWSGGANLQLLISQLQADGTLLSSALTSLALDVEAVADAPLLQVNTATIREDAPISLRTLLGRAAITDVDGSETLSFELHGLPAGARIQRLSDGVMTVLEPSGSGVYQIDRADLDGLLFVPPADLAGQMSVQWHAVARETSNGATATTIRDVLINVRAVADAPDAPSLVAVPPALVEGQSIRLSDLILQPLATSGLTDTDGSEQLRLEFTLPVGLRLQNQTNPAWAPLSAQTLADGSRVVVINAADVTTLRLADLGVRQAALAPESLQLSVTRISRELSTGDQARSSNLQFNLAFDRQARPATLTLPAAPAALEDDGGIALTALLQATASQAGDVLSYRLSGLAAGLTLVDAQGVAQAVSQNAPITLASLDGWRLKAVEHNAGQFTVDLQVISTPPGQGATAQTAVQRIQFLITPVADIPELVLGAAPAEPLTIASNGWLDLSQLQFNLSTPDADGSERLSVVIRAVDAAGDPVDLPSQAKFNVPAQQLEDGSWIVQQADLAGVNLYLGEIADDLRLAIAPRSRDGSSVAIGEETLVDVGANAVVRVPLLEVRGVLEGFEDQPIALLSQLEGVISAQLRGSGAGQILELELTDLPEGSLLVAEQTAAANQLVRAFSPALNRNADGELVTSLRLPYIQWRNVYWQGPADRSGPFSFQVQAFSVGNNGQFQESEISTVQVVITAVNDAPRLVDLQDLASIDEGAVGSWDLRSRFVDVDNDASDLRITARQVAGNGSLVDLPAWLSLDANGVLTGAPANTDVGVLQLEITAVDPLGQLTSQRVSLSVGDVNALPVFNAQALQGWTPQNQNGLITYLRTLDLRQKVQIDLAAAFDDEDLINNDQLSYSISRDGLNWSQALTGLAQIAGGILTIQPDGKENVGAQTLQLRAADLQGASNIQNLRLTVRNINDPPTVTREDAALLRAGVWQETVVVNQGQSNWALNLEGLFRDADAGDRIDQILPNSLPAWLTYTPSTTGTGGVLRGTPGNGDVGIQTLQWQALDNAGATATYRLRLDVRNVNDAPQLRANPNLSELGQLINGSPQLDQDASGRLELSELFVDPDSAYGDALRYSITSVLKDGQLLETIPDWLSLSLEQAVPPDASGKLLLEPVLHRIAADGSTGARIGPGEISQLAPGTALRVVVEATDDREIARRGLIGVDLDVSWSSALSLVTGSTQISSALPLFRKITSGAGSLRVEAGSLPDGALAIGAPIGDQAQETLLSFDVLVNEPSQRIVIGLSQGEGLNRDGLIGRQAEAFDQANSVIHSFASKIYLEASQPDNDAVGRYQLLLKAEDLAGEPVSKTLSLVIANRNDAPLVDVLGVQQTQLLKKWLAEDRVEGDRSSQSFRLFTDPDLRYRDSLSFELVPGAANAETQALLLPDSIRLQQSADGSVVLDLIPPRGLTSVIAQQFKLVASDVDGLSVASDWFTVAFRPLAEPTLLTRGEWALPLRAVQLGGASQKNATLDLQSVLDLNALTLADPEGDEVVFKVLVKQSDAELSLAGSEVADFFVRENVDEGVLFSIRLDALSQVSGEPAGSLDRLQLVLPANQFELLPRALSPSLKAGIPLQVWSETRVRGDDDARFNVAITDRATLWVPFENARPVYTAPPVTRLDAGFFAADQYTPGQVLVRLSDIFRDVDPSESLRWQLDVPKVLQGLVELDIDTGVVRLAETVADVVDLPVGCHRLVVRAKDSSGQLGDPSGIASGLIRLLVSDSAEAPAAVQGLNLLTQLDLNGVNALFDKPAEDRSESEQQVVTILESLNVEVAQRAAFMQKLEQGSLAVLANPDVNRPMLLIDASLNPGNLLVDVAVDEADAQLLSASRQLLEGREILDTPLGEIDFTIDAQGRDFSVVQLRMQQGGVAMDTLFKTDANGDPLVFRSELLTYSADLGPLDQWLAGLNYGLYYYDPVDPRSFADSPLLSISANQGSLAAALLAHDPFFDLSVVGKLDGAAYLIDLDGDTTIDLVSMLLVDQGWFDTRQDVLGLIGDPLIPISTAARAAAGGGGGGGGAAGAGGGGGGGSASGSSSTPPVPPSSEDVPTMPANEADPTRPDVTPNPSLPASVPTDPGMPDPVTSAGGSAVGDPSTSTPVVSQQALPDTAGTADVVQDSVQSDNSRGLASGKPPVAASEVGESQPLPFDPSSSRGDQSSGASSSSGGLLDSLQQWMSSRRQQASDAIRSMLSPLQQPTETSVATAIGMLLLPLLTERSATQAAKAMDRDVNLKLMRRDPNFNGRWLVLSRQGVPILIRREKGVLSLDALEPDVDDSDLTCLPGFDGDGRSLLSQAMALSREPGAFVRSLDTLRLQLMQAQAPDINWVAWFEASFEDHPSTLRHELRALNALRELKDLVNHAVSQDPALADVVMLAQVVDCASSLGLCTPFSVRSFV